MEISCVYIFDGPRKHMDLLEQWPDVSSNPAIRAEDDPGRTARCMQTTSKRKKVKSNDWNRKPRKWNVCNRRQKTIRSTRVPGDGGYSIYPCWVGRCGTAPHTLTLFKTNIADFLPCLRQNSDSDQVNNWIQIVETAGKPQQFLKIVRLF